MWNTAEKDTMRQTLPSEDGIHNGNRLSGTARAVSIVTGTPITAAAPVASAAPVAACAPTAQATTDTPEQDKTCTSGLSASFSAPATHNVNTPRKAWLAKAVRLGNALLALLRLLAGQLREMFAPVPGMAKQQAKNVGEGTSFAYLSSLGADLRRFLNNSALGRIFTSGSRVKPRGVIAGGALLSLCCFGLLANIATDRNSMHSVRGSLLPAELATFEQSRNMPDQAARLRLLATVKNSLDASQSANWHYSQKITPVDFAEYAPRPDHSPNFFAWNERSAPAPTASMLSLTRSKPSITTVAGANPLPQLTDVAISGPSLPYEAANLKRIATGEQDVETLLTETRGIPDFLRGQYFVVRSDSEPKWREGGYADDVITVANLDSWQLLYNIDDPLGEGLNGAESRQCRIDRVELASWLGKARRDMLSVNLTALERASKYSDYVERYAGDYALPPSLVYAIMRIESAFNPNAVSIANALGLMQVVPHTAGGEVHAYLTGKRGIPNRELLFAPESNIQYGTTYLYLLNSRHFKDVNNHISRELCMIAAYNGGPNAVLRSFDRRDRENAIAMINSLTPEQLYETLVRNLPSQETRDYVVKVVEARNQFRHSGISSF